MAIPVLDRVNGATITVGVVCNGDRMEVVIPVGSDDPGIIALNIGQDAVEAFEATVLPLLLDCLSQSAYVSFIACEPLNNGQLPFRKDYAALAQPGTAGLGAAPSQVAGLIVFYCDVTQLQPGDRTCVGKTFIPAVPQDDLDGDIIASAPLKTAYLAFANAMVNGWNTILAGGKWYRVTSFNSHLTNPDHLLAVSGSVVRQYVATQRRRQIPH